MRVFQHSFFLGGGVDIVGHDGRGNETPKTLRFPIVLMVRRHEITLKTTVDSARVGAPEIRVLE